MSVTIGSWGIPALVTVIAFGWVIIAGIRAPASSGYASIGDGIVMAFYVAAAIVLSLVAWLIWALVR